MKMPIQEKLAKWFIWGSALLTVSILALIVGYVMVQLLFLIIHDLSQMNSCRPPLAFLA
jgi:hypothetical protein